MKIVLFGNFGSGNLGNECTLYATIHNLRELLPSAEIHCVCSEPLSVESDYGIPAFPMTRDTARPKWALQKSSFFYRWARRLISSVPREVYHWVRSFNVLKNTDMLVMTGTGMVTDWLTTMHFDILKWTVLARLRGATVVFLSVGAGPLASGISTLAIKASLSLASYRSFRDQHSRTFLANKGISGFDDPVYPDLAFGISLSNEPASTNTSPAASVVGVGLMGYYKGSTTGPLAKAYAQYLEKIADFVSWLLGKSFTVRLIIGDVYYDDGVARDLKFILKSRSIHWESTQLIEDPVNDFHDVITQIAATDFVVATRFHNVLLALAQGKPSISISYDRKNDDLMGGFGLSEFCQSIDDFDVDKLIGQFEQLTQKAELIKPTLERCANRCRASLIEQYELVFTLDQYAQRRLSHE